MQNANFQEAAKSFAKIVEAFQKIRNEKPVIVCVDDEAPILEILQHKLEPLNCDVATFITPIEAQEFLRANHWKCVAVFSDFKMPIMDGFKFREALNVVCPNVPFLIFSGFITKEMALTGIDLKIEKFLNKPIDENEFADVIINVLVKRLTSINDDEELLKGFTEDAKQLLEQIESSMLELEEQPNNVNIVNTIFGMIHTMKGSSGFFEPKTLHVFAHKFEDLLKKVQNGNVSMNSEVVNVFLKAMDYFKIFLNELDTHNHKSYNLEEITKIFLPENFAKTEQSNVVAENKNQAVAGAGAPKTKDIRVEVEVLDEFMRASGEMTVIRNMINKTVQSIEKRFSSDKDVQALSELLSELHKVNSSVQNRITEVRKVSIKSVLKSVPRLIRDLGKALSKNCEFQTIGEDLRVDTSVAEVLNNSIVHLIRNSLDHGVETNEDRKKLGKTEPGKIIVKSYQKDEFIFVEITDNGKGINTQAVRKKAIANGLVSEEKLSKMSLEQLHLLIFESGFSTAAQVTDISGRGVGMSMVKEAVESIGGLILIKSEEGKGSTFTLKLPVPKSVLIKCCLFVGVQNEKFGIPQDNVARIIKFNKEESAGKFERLEGCLVYKDFDGLVPLLYLSEVLNLSEPPKDDKLEGMVVIVQTDKGKKFGFIVEEVFDFEDAVVKELVKALQKTNLYSGATFLGDGNVGMLLDVQSIAEKVSLNEMESKVDSDENESKVAKIANGHNWIIFEVDSPGTYSVLEKDIFRIEEIDSAKMQETAYGPVSIYRNRTMQLKKLTEIILRDESQLNQSQLTAGHGDKYQVLVMEKEGTFFGLVVKVIHDIVMIDSEIIPPISPIKGISGNLILNQKPISALNSEEIISIIKNNSTSVKDNQVAS